MVRKQAFTLLYDTEVNQHLRTIDRKFYALIRVEIENQLRYEPTIETKNRKPLLRPAPSGATWELRLGPNNRFRVYYRADTETHEVFILAVGEKQRERVYVGKEEYLL